MNTFLTVALISLALKVALQVIDDLVPALKSQQSLVTIVAAIGTAYILNYSLFDQLGVAFRNQDVEKVVTGIALAGMITVWNTVLSYLGSKHSEETTKSTSSSTHRIAA
jgi:hypothetical protein